MLFLKPDKMDKPELLVSSCLIKAPEIASRKQISGFCKCSQREKINTNTVPEVYFLFTVSVGIKKFFNKEFKHSFDLNKNI